jgi:hypothetical protein
VRRPCLEGPERSGPFSLGPRQTLRQALRQGRSHGPGHDPASPRNPCAKGAWRLLHRGDSSAITLADGHDARPFRRRARLPERTIQQHRRRRIRASAHRSAPAPPRRETDENQELAPVPEVAARRLPSRSPQGPGVCDQQDAAPLQSPSGLRRRATPAVAQHEDDRKGPPLSDGKGRPFFHARAAGPAVAARQAQS